SRAHCMMRLAILLCVSVGCTLVECNLKEIHVFSGQSVLLPCSCQEPVILTQSDLYIDRVELLNRKHPGNLSVLLSHLTQDDQGDYRCTLEDSDNWDIERDIRLHVKGKILISGLDIRSPGQSVLLPCSCNELQAKPHKLTWTKLPAIPLTKCDLYRDRVAMFNTESSPGNLSVLLSFITKEDQGWYRCTINNQDTRDIHITVEGKRSDNDPFYECCLHTEKQALHSPFKLTFSFILIIAGMALYIYKRNKSIYPQLQPLKKAMWNVGMVHFVY
uniref:Ig-like domain-containing protein n=1 Tax=Oncorhynchus kisutch TaxID=8019 RepID=A0A8C7CEF9_ONCKI